MCMCVSVCVCVGACVLECVCTSCVAAAGPVSRQMNCSFPNHVMYQNISGQEAAVVVFPSDFSLVHSLSPFSQR